VLHCAYKKVDEAGGAPSKPRNPWKGGCPERAGVPTDNHEWFSGVGVADERFAVELLPGIVQLAAQLGNSSRRDSISTRRPMANSGQSSGRDIAWPDASSCSSPWPNGEVFSGRLTTMLASKTIPRTVEAGEWLDCERAARTSSVGVKPMHNIEKSRIQPDRREVEERIVIMKR
jgi:hypothetical protein